MTTPPVVSITDELIEELEGEIRIARAINNRAPIHPDDLESLLAERADLKQQLAAAAITADNCELFRKDAERMRYALERLAQVPGCGCSFPCRCGGAEWTRAELEGRMDLAADALARSAAD